MPDALESALHEQRLRRFRWNSDGSALSEFLHRPDAYLYTLLKNNVRIEKKEIFSKA